MHLIRPLAILACACAVGTAAEVLNLDFEKDTVGVQPPKLGVATLTTTAERTAVVATGIAGLTGNALRFTRPVGEASYTPGMSIQVGALSGGKITLAMNVMIEQVKTGPKFPGTEALFAIRAIGRDGRLFYQFRCVADGDGQGGNLSSHDKNVGEWSAGMAMPVVITLDLAASTATVSVHGAEVVKDQKLDFPAPMVQFQICDGTALGGIDSGLTFALDDVIVTTTP